MFCQRTSPDWDSTLIDEPTIMEVIDTGGLSKKLGYIVMDNAPNNDVMMQFVSEGLFSTVFYSNWLTIIDMLSKYDIYYDPKTHRIRCQGHIINLSVNDFIYVTNTKLLEENEENIGSKQITQVQLKQSLAEIEEWRKCGPIGCLHNIIVDIQSSSQRLQEFLKLSKNTRPVRDNKTRWNSMAKSVKSSITSPVFEAINAYVRRHADESVGQDALSDDDWKALRDIHDFLDLLSQTTLALETSTSTLDAVLPAMDFILEQFEQFKERYKHDKKLASMFNSGWKKMVKYYKLTDESPAYVAGIVLDPNAKWKYIENNWNQAWVPRARVTMEKFWDEHKPANSSTSTSTTSITNEQPIVKNAFSNWKKRHVETPSNEDEYKRYCAAECVLDVDPRTWWQETTQQVNYPTLSKLALDILSIPAMSADCERLFSSAKILISDLRNRLGMDIIEAFECLKSWYKMRGFEGEFKVFEELFGAEVEIELEGLEELGTQTDQTAVQAVI